MTESKRLRTFDWNKKAVSHEKVAGFRPKPTRGAMQKRDTIQSPTERRNAGICPFCSLPVLVAEGQVINGFKQLDGTFVPSHKLCRKRAK